MCPASVSRALTRRDTEDALALYSELTFGPACSDPEHFHRVLDHDGTMVIGAFAENTLVSMVTLHLLPNVTWGGRPYGVLENVVTRADRRNRGFGRAAMACALSKAWEADAYKVMVLTGQKRAALGFYTSLGFSREDKHGLVIRKT